MASLVLIVAMFALLYLLLIRPQRQRQAEQRQMIETVEPGDEVLTVGGIYGIVQEVDEEDDLIVEIAEGIQVRVSRRAVGAVVKPDDDEDEETDGEGAKTLDSPDVEAAIDGDGVAAVNDREDEVSDAGPADPAAARRS